MTSYHLETCWRRQRYLHSKVRFADSQGFAWWCQTLVILILLWVELWRKEAHYLKKKKKKGPKIAQESKSLPSTLWKQNDSEERTWVLKSEKPEFYHILVVGSWAMCLFSLGLSFLICQVGVVTLSRSFNGLYIRLSHFICFLGAQYMWAFSSP